VTSRARLVAVALACVALVGLFVGGSRLVGSPSFVDGVSVRNDSEFAVLVQVRGEDASAWTNAGTVRSNSTDRFDEVADQGRVWTFRFSVQGVVGGEFETTRAALKTSGWTISIPPHVIEKLRAEGASALQ